MIDPAHVASLYTASRAKYTRSLKEVQKAVIEKQETISKLEEFGAPIL